MLLCVMLMRYDYQNMDEEQRSLWSGHWCILRKVCVRRKKIYFNQVIGAMKSTGWVREPSGKSRELVDGMSTHLRRFGI